MTYFEDYQEIEARNKKSKSVESVKAKLKGQGAADDTVDPE